MSVGDLSNREDRPAYVRFERRAVENKAKSLEAGRYIADDVDFALITPPYSRDCVEHKVSKWLVNIERNAKDGRVPQKYVDYWKESYRNWQNGQEMPLNGSPIKEWSAISPAQIKNLIAINILTIEDLAQVNEQGLRRIGMGGLELKNKAIAWLQAATDHGPLTMQVTQLQNENEQLKGTIQALSDQMKGLSMQIERQHTAPLKAVTTLPSEITMDDITDDLQELRDQYFNKFHKKPHHLMKEKGLLEALST